MINQFRILSIALFTCLVLGLALPVLVAAQEATPDAPDITVNDGGTVIVNPPADAAPAAPEFPKDLLTALLYCITAVVIVSVILYAHHKGITVKQAYWGLPAPVTEFGYPATWKYRWSLAQGTPDPADNMALKEEARFLGYRLTEQPGGGVLLERDPATIPPVG